MRVLNHCHSVRVSSNRVFDWFTNLDKNYLTWHPISHRSFQWLSEKPVVEGSTFMMEEQIGRHNHKMLMKISDIFENQRILFSSVRIEMNSKYAPNWFISVLISLFRIKMEMHRLIENKSEQVTTIKLTHKIGSQIPVIHKLVDFVIEHFIISSKSHLEHIEEKALNMKTALEKNNI